MMYRYVALTFSLVLVVVANISIAHDLQSPLSIEHYPLEKVSEHIYVVHGTQKLPSPQTRGFMNNPAAILTDKGVIIVDPGSSAEIGKQLLKKVREVSDKPVLAVFNTHVHGDHWLGNQGIREIYPHVPIYAHKKMIERVNNGEGKEWIQLFMKMTEGKVTGTEVVSPNVGLKGGEVLKLGGLTLKIYHAGHAHTNHDIMIEVVDDKGIFLGDIVTAKRVSNSDVPQDANFKGTISAIKTVLSKPYDIYIPGHGLSGDREVPESSLKFLEQLYSSVSKYIDQDFEVFEMKKKVIEDLAEYKDWNNFNELGRVINYVFLEIENDNF